MRHKALNPKQDGQEERIQSGRHQVPEQDLEEEQKSRERQPVDQLCGLCLLYTSDAADDWLVV